MNDASIRIIQSQLAASAASLRSALVGAEHAPLARRAGTTVTLDVLMKYLSYHEMPIISTTYWPATRRKKSVRTKRALFAPLPRSFIKLARKAVCILLALSGSPCWQRLFQAIPKVCLYKDGVLCSFTCSSRPFGAFYDIASAPAQRIRYKWIRFDPVRRTSGTATVRMSAACTHHALPSNGSKSAGEAITLLRQPGK